METKNILIICITVLIIGVIIAGAAYMIMDKQIKLQEQKLNQNNNTTKVVNNTTVVKEVTKEPEKQAVGYKSDGTPMYSQAEVSNYVKSKYGCVDYHLQDNGYVALDDPHYTSDGHRIK